MKLLEMLTSDSLKFTPLIGYIFVFLFVVKLVNVLLNHYFKSSRHKKFIDKICANSSISNGLFIGLLFFALFFISLVYEANFGVDLHNKNDFKIWVDVAVYLNNMLTPVLLGASIFLLYKTWQTSETELKETRNVLKSQTELLLFDKITSNLHYLTDELRYILERGIAVNKDSFEGVIEKLEQANTFERESCFWPDQDSALVKKVAPLPNYTHINIGKGPNARKDTVTFSSLLHSLDGTGVIERSDYLRQAKFYAERVVLCFLLKEESPFVEELDNSLIELMSYLSQIETPELRKIIFKQTFKNLEINHGTNYLFGLYKKRIYQLERVKHNESLQSVIKDFYAQIPLKLIPLEEELITYLRIDQPM